MLLACVVLGGCGGGGEDRLSRTEIAAQANRICQDKQAEAAAIEVPESIEDPDVAAEYFNGVAPILQAEVDELSELEPDADVREDWEAFLAAERAANELLQAIRDKAGDRDPSGLEDVQQLQPATEKVTRTAKAVGADACGAA